MLNKNKIDRREIELITAHVLNKSREFLIAHPEQKINKTKKQTIIKLINKRKRGIPLAYLTGHKEFFGLDFIVNKHTLIPRPETELIVTETLKQLNTKTQKQTILIDVGTGSGCIPISIIKTLKHKNIKTFAIDISKPALLIAKKNAKKHRVKASQSSAHAVNKIKFLHGDLLLPITNCHPEFISGSFTEKNILESKIIGKMLKPVSTRQGGQIQHDRIIITANLPYLTEEQFKTEPSIQHEPKSALVAGKNGHELYEKLFKQIKKLSTVYCLLPTIYCEIDPRQTKNIKQLIKKYLPKAKIVIHQDLARLNRVVEIKI